MKSLPTLLAFVSLTAASSAQIGMQWSSTSGGDIGNHAVTAAGFDSAALINVSYSGSDFSGAPFAGSQSSIRYEGSSNWTVDVTPAISRLLWYGSQIRGAGGSPNGQPVLYVFDQPFEIISGFGQATVFANTLRLPSTGIHQGILRFINPVSSLSCSTNNVNTAFHRCTFGQYDVDLGTAYCSPAVINSTGVPAWIEASGSDFPFDNLFTLGAHALPQNMFGFFLTSQSQDSVPMLGGGEGTLCLGGAIGRFLSPGQILNTGIFGDVELPIDLTAHPTPTGFVQVASGETWNFQFWYRDTLAGVPTSNLTDGLSVTFR